MAAVRESCGNMKVGVYLKMKRIIAFAAAAVMLASMAGCGDSSSKGEAASSSVSSQAVYSAAASKLTSKMTETEKQRVNMHGLTLLDEAKVDENEQHKVGIAFHKVTEQEYLENLKMSLEQGLITQKQYDERKGEYTENSYPTVAYIDGQPTTADVMILQQFAESDGAVEFTVSDPKDPEKENTIKVNSFAEYLDWLKRYRLSSGSSEQAESAVKQAELIKKAFADNTYETVPEGDVQMNYGGYDPYIDYRSNWEFDRESAQQRKERIKEIDIYDEQLGTQFLAHVVLPKDYDKEKTYPVLFMTDGVYRFGDALRLTKQMEEGKAQDAIIITLGYGYHYDGSNEGLRMNYLVNKRTQLVDFITDDLMPYISENFKIDCTKSTLYGHSDGGVFAHCALMTSDKYDNQPFSAYIIGSPVFWATYETESYDAKSVENDYGYWERNEKLGKKVFLCAGSLEDSDYADSFNGHPSTLKGLENLKERLEKHGTDLTYKLYESHHYQFIPDMLDEWLKDYYKA